MILRAAATTLAMASVFGGVALTSIEPSTPEPAVLGISLARNENSNGNGNAYGLVKQQVVASGAVSGLYPGAVRDLVVTLRNENNFPVAVTDLTVAVRSTTPGCTAAVVRVDEFHGSFVVAANSSATKALAARMHNDAPDSCKGSSFALTYTGTAVKP